MKIIQIIAVTIIIAGCASDLKLSLYSIALKNGRIKRVAIVKLGGSAYPIHHNVYAVKDVSFSTLAIKALEDAIALKKKGWKVIYPSNVNAADPDIQNIFSVKNHHIVKKTCSLYSSY